MPKSKIFVCDQHDSNISTKLQKFYQEQLFVDIALITKPGNFKMHAHRTVLSASSEYFLEIICCNLKEAKSDELELEIDEATLRLVIDFMYSGTIELRSENIARLLIAALTLKMSSLQVACSDFIGECIGVTNCLSIASLPKQHVSAELHNKAVEFALQNFEEVCKMEDFLQLTEEQLKKLISSDDLCVKSEETVFDSLVSWVEYDRANHSVSKSYECFELIFSWLEFHLSSIKLSERHSERKKAYRMERERLGFVIKGKSEIFKINTLDAETLTWSCEDFPPPKIVNDYYRANVIDKKLFASTYESKIIQCLNCQTKEWITLPPMRYTHSYPEVAILNGDIYVVGGSSKSVEKYDIRTCEWKELLLAPMHSCHILEVTVLGEFLYAAFDKSIECYNPVNNKWTQIADKNEKSSGFRIAGVGGHLYAVGGIYNRKYSKTVERYNPSTETWTIVSPGLELVTFDYLCVCWNNRLVVVSKECDYSDPDSFDEYSPQTNEWKALPRSGFAIVAQIFFTILHITK